MEAAETVEAVALVAEASQEATPHLFTLAVRTPGYMELVAAARAAAHFWSRKKNFGVLAKFQDQRLVDEVATVVQAANGAMVLLKAVCLAVADLHSTVASADSVDEAVSEVPAPATDWEAYSAYPAGLAEKVKE